MGFAERPDEATWRGAFERKMFYDDPETRTAFVDAIAEILNAIEPIFHQAVVNDLLIRTR